MIVYSEEQIFNCVRIDYLAHIIKFCHVMCALMLPQGNAVRRLLTLVSV